MNEQSNTPNASLNFNYQALDQFLSQDTNPQKLREQLEEIEAELFTEPSDLIDAVPVRQVETLQRLFTILGNMEQTAG